MLCRTSAHSPEHTICNFNFLLCYTEIQGKSYRFLKILETKNEHYFVRLKGLIYRLAIRRAIKTYFSSYFTRHLNSVATQATPLNPCLASSDIIDCARFFIYFFLYTASQHFRHAKSPSLSFLKTQE